MNIRKITLLAIDSLLLVATYILTFIISTLSESTSGVEFGRYFLNFIFYYIAIFAVRFSLRIYSNVWRYANVFAYLSIVLADTIGYLFATVLTRAVFINFVYVTVWYTILNISLFSLLTLISRFIYQFYMNKKNNSPSDSHQIPVAIVGAGQTGSLLVEELMHNSNSHYKPVCFIDRDKYKVGGYISGVKVIADGKNAINILKALAVKEIFIALPKLTSVEAQNLYDHYSKTGCKIKLYDFAINGETGALSGKRNIRDIKIEDLLFRDALKINNSETFEYYNDKKILVTGGGGSIGSEICRQLAKINPKQLIVFDIYENNAYDIQQELIGIYGDELNLSVEIGSVRDIIRLDEIFKKYKPDVVFHAAAHKHVPLMENACGEAIKNNVFGTYNTAEMAEKYKVGKFIMISTDKAVNPTNVMGASKRLCEMIVQSRFDSEFTEFAAVRFGNVLGSNGSVIPLFRRQIEAGGPITITDKRIIRYFMTIPEASQLVMQAGAMAKKGELYVLDMGNPIKIIDLATSMIKLAGYTPYEDIDIVETGLRPGEKLYEELLIKDDSLVKTQNDLIFVEHFKPNTRENIDKRLQELNDVLYSGNDEIISKLKEIVPTFKSPEMVNISAEDSKEMKMANN